MTVAKPVQNFGKDLEAMSFAVNYHKWILDWPGLAALAGRAGFRTVHAHYFGIAGILPWYVNFVLLGNYIGSGSVSAYDRLVVPLMRRVERRMPPIVGKNIVLVARKD